MFGPTIQRRKLTTYGKPNRNPTWDLQQDEASSEKPRVTTLGWKSEQKKPVADSSQTSRKAIGVLIKPSPRKEKESSEWDVPTSDEESTKRPIAPTKSLKPLKNVQDSGWDVPTSDEETTRPSLLSTKPTKSSKSLQRTKEPLQNNGQIVRSRQASVDLETRRRGEISQQLVPRPTARQKSVPHLAPAPTLKRTIESSQPARKRQRTPARQSPPAIFIAQRTRSRTTTPEPTRVPRATSKESKNAAKSSLAQRRRMNTGSSAPAALFSMIREPTSLSTDSSENMTVPSNPNSHSEMDIDAPPSTPPMHSPAPPATAFRNGSVTPRQKELWGKLLGSDSVEGPSDLPLISKLNLSSSRKIASLNRSASDIPQTTHSKRVRLIDTLKASAPIEEEDEEMDDVEGPEESDDESSSSTKPASLKVISDQGSQQMEAVVTSKIKVTYAQQRSHLQPQNEEAAFDLMVEEMTQSNETHNSQLQDEEPEEESQGARGFHDLKVAGSNLRLNDTFDHLVNDIEGISNSLSVRRSVLMELATKFMDASAVTFFLDRGFDRRLINAVGDMGDTSSGFIVAAAFALLSEGGAGSNVLQSIHQCKWYAKATGLLDFDTDIGRVIRDRGSNMSKMAQTSVLEFKESLLKSKLWKDTTPKTLSPRLMALKCFELLVRKLREHGSQDVLLDESTIEKLLAIAESHIGRGDNSTLGPVLSALESSTITPGTQKKPANWSTKLVKMFARLLPSLIMSSTSSDSQRCGDLALRLALNLSNENPRASDVFGSTGIIQPLLQCINQNFDRLTHGLSLEERDIALERLTLALGVMINLAEHSEKVRLSAIEGNDLPLNSAIQLFLAGRERTCQADSLEAVQSNVPYGYLAILFANLCQNQKVRRAMQNKLPSGDLGVLVNAVDEFTKLHQTVDKQFEGDEGEELYSHYTARLQKVATRLRRVAVT